MQTGSGTNGRRQPGEFKFAAVALSALILVASAAGQAATTMTIEGDFRVIVSDGIPNHETGQFPNRDNPNTIRPQKYTFRISLSPKVSETTTVLEMAPFGVAMNGVVFDPFAAGWWQRNPATGWQYEPMSGSTPLGLDANNAHVQPDGAYHYHGIPTSLMNALGEVKEPVMLGYAADGFPIYGPFGYKDPKDAKSEVVKLRSSYRIRQGTRPNGPGGTYDGSFVQDYEYRPGAGDLDECNGRFGVTPHNPTGTYYYVLTDAFPFVPRIFRGTPDDSVLHRGRQAGPPGRGRNVAGQNMPGGGQQFSPGMPPPRQGHGFRRAGGADMADQDFPPPHPPYMRGGSSDEQRSGPAHEGRRPGDGMHTPGDDSQEGTQSRRLRGGQGRPLSHRGEDGPAPRERSPKNVDGPAGQSKCAQGPPPNEPPPSAE